MKNLYFALLALLLAACEFLPSDIYFEEVTIPPVNNSVQVRTNAASIPEGDTIFCYIPQYVFSNLQKPTSKVYKVEVLFNGVKMVEGNELLITPNQAPFLPGKHRITFRYYLSSNSGSLADLLEAETVVLEQSWWVRIDTPKASPIKINGLEVREGKPYLKYTPSSLPNVTAMKVRYKSPMFPNINAEENITDFRAQEVALTWYYGDSLEASIEVQTSATNITPGETFKAYTPILELSAKLSESSCELSWTRPTLYANVYEVSVVDRNNYPYGSAPGEQSGTANINFIPIFGSRLYGELYIMSRFGYEGYIPIYRKKLDLPLPKGAAMPSFSKMAYHHASSSYYLMQGSKLICVNANTHQVKSDNVLQDASVYGILASADGSRLFLYRDAGASSVGVWEITPGTAKLGAQVHTFADVLPSQFKGIAVSNNGRMAYKSPDASGANNNVVVYDLVNKQELYRKVQTTLLLSDDGKYISDTYEVAELKEGGAQVLPGVAFWDYTQSSNPIVSFVGNGRIAYVYEQTVKIFEFADGEVKEERAFTINALRNDFQLHYDSQNSVIAFMVYDTFAEHFKWTQMRAFNYATGAQIATLSINNGSFDYFSGPYYYFNRHCYLGGESNDNGAYIKLF